MAKELRIFISHRMPTDTAMAEKIGSRLALYAGNQVKVTHAGQFRYGEKWREKINERLDTTDWLIFLFPPRAKAGAFADACEPCRLGTIEQPLSLNKTDDFSKTDAFPEVAHDEWAFASHLSRVALHHCERSADVGSKVHLVNYQQIGLGDARAALARNLFAACYVDHVNGQVGKLRAESGSKIVAPRFNKHDVGIWVFLQHAIDGFQIN